MVLQKLARVGEGHALRRLETIVGAVNGLEREIEALSGAELAAKTGEFRRRLADGQTLEDILPEAFACVREAAKRSIGQRHFDVQVMGAVVLHQARIQSVLFCEPLDVAHGHAHVQIVGARLEDVLPKSRREGRKSAAEQRRHPFAGLAALRDKSRRGR